MSPFPPMIRCHLRAGVVLRMGLAAMALALPLAGCANAPSATFDLSAAASAR